MGAKSIFKSLIKPITQLLLIFFVTAVPSIAQSEYSYEELVELARKFGLDSRGNRLVLEARLGDLLKKQSVPIENLPTTSLPRTLVESADSGEYIQKDSGDELILQGNVILTMIDEEFETTHHITADLIVYNQELRQLSAQGNVLYIMTGSRNEERFEGDRLIFLLHENETMFIHGLGHSESKVSSEAAEILSALEKSTTFQYLYNAEIITRNLNNVIVLDKGEIRSSNNMVGGYRLRFSKMWVLSPGEWGIKRAGLYVGNIPVMGLPFMYLPGNEVVFHPVFIFGGSRGYGLNTTTYLAGRLDKEDSGFSFLQMSNSSQEMEQELMGIFLEPTDRPLEEKANDKFTFETIKLILDLYSVRGIVAGISAQSGHPQSPSLNLDVALGFTRDIYSSPTLTNATTAYYTNAKGTQSERYHKISVFGQKIPLRFIFSVSGSASFPQGSFDFSLPLYSDPYIYSEYTDRSEEMPWSNLVLEGTASTELGKFKENPMDWDLSFDYQPSITDFLSPLISSFSISELVSHFAWNDVQPINYSKLDTSYTSARSSPYTRQYWPEKWQLPSGTVLINGTFLSLSARTPEAATIEEFDISDWSIQLPETEVEEDEWFSAPRKELLEPEISKLTYSGPAKSLAEYELGYSFTNSHYVTLGFHDPLVWKDSNLVPLPKNPLPKDHSFLPSYYSFKDVIKAGLNQNISLGYGFAEITTDITYNAVFKKNFGYSRLYDTGNTDLEAPIHDKLQKEKSSLKKNNKTDTQQSFSVQNKAILNLLQPWYGDVSLSVAHNLGMRLWKRQDDLLQDDLFSWDKDHVQSHNLHVAFDQPLDMYLPLKNSRQKIQLGYELPPLKSSLNYAYQFSSVPFAISLSNSVSLSEDQPKFENINMNARITPWEEIYMDTKFVYSPQEKSPKSWTTKLGIHAFITTLTFEERFDTTPDLANSRWNVDRSSDPQYKLSRLSSVLDIPINIFKKSKISLDSSAKLQFSQDFVEFTKSSLSFEFELKLLVPELLLIRFSSKSANTQMYNYIPEYYNRLNPTSNREAWRLPLDFFVDLFKSFNFFDTKNGKNDRTDREIASFNLQSLNLELFHDLGDWILSTKVSWMPKIINQEYRFETKISIFLQWLPIAELKNNIEIIAEGNDVKINY